MLVATKNVAQSTLMFSWKNLEYRAGHWKREKKLKDKDYDVYDKIGKG